MNALVLLVEDEPALRKLLARMLASDGFRVLVASDGEAALALADMADGPIAVLVTDVVLPGMSGPTLARRMAKRVPGLQTLFVSGYGQQHLLRYDPLPADSTLLVKPFARADLLDAVHRLRGRAAVRQANTDR